MYWKAIRPSRHFIEHHKDALSWEDLLRIVYSTKSRRRKGNKYEIEDDKIYILAELKEDILYIINVKTK